MDDTPHAHRLGQLWVLLQFALIGALAALAWPTLRAGTVPGWAWALTLAAAALAVWTLAVNRLGNFNIHPSPRAGGRLVVDGPYRWVRHPMYVTVLLCAVAAIGASAWPPASLLLGAALAAVLWAKGRLEERWMAQAHPGYAAYAARTARWIPGLF